MLKGTVVCPFPNLMHTSVQKQVEMLFSNSDKRKRMDRYVEACPSWSCTLVHHKVFK